MGRCAYGTLITLFVLIFTFSLMLLIGRTVFLSSFLQGTMVTVVPMNMGRTLCHLMSVRTEVCLNGPHAPSAFGGGGGGKSWVTVWTLGPPENSQSITDTAVVGPFTSRSTLQDAMFDRNKYPTNHTYPCMCPTPFADQSHANHTHASVCNYKQACMLDVEEVEGLIVMQHTEAAHYTYIATILAVVGVFLLLISIGGGVSVGVIMWYQKQYLPKQKGSDAYKKFTIGEDED